MTQHRIAEQKTVTVGGGIRRQQYIVMSEVMTERVFKRQLDVAQVRICRHVHGQARAGEMSGIVQTDVMFNYRCFRAFRQLQMMTIVRRVHLLSGYATGDMHQQQRLYRALIALNADMRHATRRFL